MVCDITSTFHGESCNVGNDLKTIYFVKLSLHRYLTLRVNVTYAYTECLTALNIRLYNAQCVSVIHTEYIHLITLEYVIWLQ